MNAIDCLLSHYNMLRSIRGIDAPGCLYLTDKIKKVAASGNLEIVPGTTSTGHPTTLSGYKAAISEILGETSLAVTYLDGLIAERGGNFVVEMDESNLAYQMGLIDIGSSTSVIGLE